jgi:hypothetical protein
MGGREITKNLKFESAFGILDLGAGAAEHSIVGYITCRTMYILRLEYLIYRWSRIPLQIGDV